MLCDLALEVRRLRRLKSCLRTNWSSRIRLKRIFRVMEQDHSPVMRVFVEYDIGKGIAWQPEVIKWNNIKKTRKKQFQMSVCILYPVCILYLVCILYPVCSLQSAFCTDRHKNPRVIRQLIRFHLFGGYLDFHVYCDATFDVNKPRKFGHSVPKQPHVYKLRVAISSSRYYIIQNVKAEE